MYDGLGIGMESDCVLTRKSTNSCELIWELLNQVISGFDGLVAAGAAVGLTAVAVGEGAGLGGFVSGWITVMAQFILTTTNLLHVGSPRMAGPGVSATYQ